MMRCIIFHVLSHWSMRSTDDFTCKIKLWNRLKIKNKKSKRFWLFYSRTWSCLIKRLRSCIEKKSVILMCHKRSFKATTFVFDVFIENQKVHFFVNTPFAIFIYKFMKIKCSTWIVNITSKFVFFVNSIIILFN